MGFLQKLFGNRDRAAEPASAPLEPPAAPEPPPAALVVLRQGMDVPDGEYLRQVAAAEKPGLPESVALRGLSQPRWFAKDEWMASGARIVADAFQQELDIDPAKTGYWESRGPDGAKILVVFLRR